jgi:hypothetical protein
MKEGLVVKLGGLGVWGPFRWFPWWSGCSSLYRVLAVGGGMIGWMGTSLRWRISMRVV